MYPKLREDPELAGAEFAILLLGHQHSVPRLLGVSIAAGAIAEFCEAGTTTATTLGDACDTFDRDMSAYTKYFEPQHLIHTVSDTISALRDGQVSDGASWSCFFKGIEQETLAMASVEHF